MRGHLAFVVVAAVHAVLWWTGLGATPSRALHGSASFHVGAAPSILYPPTATSAILGQEAIFTVIAVGEGPLSYQWRKDGVDLADGPNIHGANSDVLRLRTVEGHGGRYDILVKSASGWVISDHVPLELSFPRGGDLDFAFAPATLPAGFDGEVRALASDKEGRIVVGGAFSRVHRTLRANVARLNPDGTLDPTFGHQMAGADGIVYAVAIDGAGRTLIGGEFGHVHGVGRRRIARLNLDGSLDPSFLDGLSGVEGAVACIQPQPDGKVLIGGAFTAVHGVPRANVARLHPDGSLDAAFLQGLAGANGHVLALALQPDGRVVIAGPFSSVNGTGRNRIARLHTDGSLDTGFLSGMSGLGFGLRGMGLDLQPDGKIVVGGGFSIANGVQRRCVARLHPDGSLDTSFQDPAVARLQFPAVEAVRVQPDGKILIGGFFTTAGGALRNGFARLNADGTLDATFKPPAGGFARAIVLLSGADIALGGAIGTETARGVARVHPDGTLDAAFMDHAGGRGGSSGSGEGSIGDLALQPDGKVVVGGDFFRIESMDRDGIARLHPDGSLDRGFQAGITSLSLIPVVPAVALQADGKVLIGGNFSQVQGVSRNRIARLEADGSLDTSFLDGLSGPNGNVSHVEVLADGAILIAGSFSTVHGTARNDLARLLPDGSLDATFPGESSGSITNVYAVAVQTDGKILIGGQFPSWNGFSRPHIARLNPDGSVDTKFVDNGADLDGHVEEIRPQPDGKLLFAGGFTAIGGVPRGGMARLNTDGSLDSSFLDPMISGGSVMAIAVQPDGKILVGGTFTSISGSARQRIARLNSDGSLDSTFQEGLDGVFGQITISPGARVACLALQPDGSVLIGGEFQRVNGVPASQVARLHGDASGSPEFPSVKEGVGRRHSRF